MSGVFFQAVGSGVPIIAPDHMHAKAIAGRARPYMPGYQGSPARLAEDRRSLSG
jgi:hypothetical protein